MFGIIIISASIMFGKKRLFVRVLFLLHICCGHMVWFLRFEFDLVVKTPARMAWMYGNLIWICVNFDRVAISFAILASH